MYESDIELIKKEKEIDREIEELERKEKALNKSTEEIYELRQKEVNLLQRLLDTEQTVTHLISELSKQKFKDEVKEAKNELNTNR